MTDRITGGCACGAIRFACNAAPLAALHCQCRDCQRFSGAGHMSIVIVPKAAVTVTGAPAFYTTASDSGETVERGFCPRCGSPVLGRYSGFPDAVGLPAGGLDDPGLFAPSTVIFAERGHAWDKMDPALPQFPRMMPRGRR